MSDEKSHTEESKSTTETKTNAFGIPEKDTAGEYIKETTTKTEVTESSDDEKD
jgi:ABC-type molybdate transport system substrate-binding protein